MEQQRDLVSLFQPQGLREYIASYNSICATGSIATTLVTKTTATKGEGRRAPKTIEPWRPADIGLERAIVDAVLKKADSDSLLFPERQHVVHVGEDLARLDSENALLLYDSDTLHKPASRIMRSLLAVEHIRTAIALAIQHHSRAGAGGAEPRLRPGKVSFPTHRNLVPSRSLTKRKRKRDDEDEDLHPSNTVPFRRLGPADVFCIFESEPHAGPRPPSHNAMEESITVATDSKPAQRNSKPKLHKFTAEIIEKAVGKGDRVLDSRAIMGRGFLGSDMVDLDVEECEYWFAAVCTQLYTSMIDEDCLYGVITTGVHYIFVFIDPENPSVLRYSVCHDRSDVRGSPILRLIALMLLALHDSKLPRSPEVDMIWERQGLNWITGRGNPSFYDDGDAAAPTPQTESWRAQHSDGDQSASPDAQQRTPSGIPSVNSVDVATREHVYPSPPPNSSTSVLGKRQRQDEVDVPGDEPEATCTKRLKLQEIDIVSPTPGPKPTSPISSPMGSPVSSLGKWQGQDADDVTTGTPTLPAMPGTPTSSPLTSPASPKPVFFEDRAYCSTACLLALRRNPSEPQPLCPNHAEHIRATSPVTETSQLRRNLKDQLMKGGWHYRFERFRPGSGYARPVKIWLRSHGYILFAKVFQPEEIQKMRREAQIYDRLRHLQGIDVPVCLGSLELPIEKSLTCSGVKFTGLLLLSYAGFGMDAWPRLELDLGRGGEADRSFARSLTAEVMKALGRIHEKGVLHRDVALRNVLVQRFTRAGPPSHPTFDLQIQLIDFERSRTRSGYRYNAAQVRKLKGVQEGDAGRRVEDIGNEDFVQACVKEIAYCSRVISEWYEPGVIYK